MSLFLIVFGFLILSFLIEKGKEKEGKAEEVKLFAAQQELVQEFLSVLLAQLSKPLTADPGLLPVSTLISF